MASLYVHVVTLASLPGAPSCPSHLQSHKEKDTPTARRLSVASTQGAQFFCALWSSLYLPVRSMIQHKAAH